MTRTLICCNHRFIIGGIETYYIRMFEWAAQNGIRIVLLLCDKGEFDHLWDRDLQRLGVEIYFYKLSPKYGKVISSNYTEICFEKEEDITFIVPTVSNYAMSLHMTKKYHLNAKSLFYVFDPVHIRITKVKFIRFIYKKLVLENLWNNGIIFMDEETLEYALKCYGFPDPDRSNIMRPGYYFQEFDSNWNKERLANKGFTILSVCRMQFPFKAYVIGLIKVFTYIEKKYKNFKLVIVGEGENSDELYNVWNQLDDDIKNRIELVGKVEYDKLGNYFKNANIYVGMGTTLLDAANYGLIGIIATAYQYQDYSFGFFHEHYNIVGGLLDEGGDRYHVKDLIEQAVQWTPEEYISASQKTYKMAKEHYDINNIMARIMEKKVKKLDSKRVFLLLCFEKILTFPRRIIHVIKKRGADNLIGKEETIS